MDKKRLAIISIIVIGVIVPVLIFTLSNEKLPSINTLKTNERIGLVVNPTSNKVTISDLDKDYAQASSSGIGRSNVYLFWNSIEPERGNYNWKQSDVLMSLNKKNNLKVTLFFSIVNGEKLGPFPSWLGTPGIKSIPEDDVVKVLDAILSRYNIIDTVIISGQTEEQFRYDENLIPIYKDFFNGIYTEIKEKHPNVKIGNSFALHNVLNKKLENIVGKLELGDFVAYTYFPVDSLNEITKTPDDAKHDLQKALDLSHDKKIAFFELGWSTSNFVQGNITDQKTFLEKSFEFFKENEPKIEFLTWYRQNDRNEDVCKIQEINGTKSTAPESVLGTSEFVTQRLEHYVCDSGLIDKDGNPKPAWDEFKKQINSQN